MKAFLVPALPLALAACITVEAPDEPSPGSDALVYAQLNQTVAVGGPRVTPLEVLEDSRCPANVQCVWAGQVRLRLRIATGADTTTREIVSSKPLGVADGTLTLAEVGPTRQTNAAPTPADYRFGFRYDGGL